MAGSRLTGGEGVGIEISKPAALKIQVKRLKRGFYAVVWPLRSLSGMKTTYLALQRCAIEYVLLSQSRTAPLPHLLVCSANHSSFCFVFLTSLLLPLGHRVTLFLFPNQHSPTSTYALTKALLQVEPYSCVTEEQRRNNFSLFQLSCPSLHKHGSTHIPVNSAFCFHSCWLLLLFFFNSIHYLLQIKVFKG